MPWRHPYPTRLYGIVQYEKAMMGGTCHGVQHYAGRKAVLDLLLRNMQHSTCHGKVPKNHVVVQLNK